MPRDERKANDNARGLTPVPLNETAQTEIELREAEDREMDALERQWKTQRDSIALKPAQEPHFDMGGVSVRNIQQEYTEKRAQHEHRADEIANRFSALRESVREVGTTLSGEFHHAHGQDADLSEDVQHSGDKADSEPMNAPSADSHSHTRDGVHYEFNRQTEPPQRGRSR